MNTTFLVPMAVSAVILAIALIFVLVSYSGLHRDWKEIGRKLKAKDEQLSNLKSKESRLVKESFDLGKQNADQERQIAEYQKNLKDAADMRIELDRRLSEALTREAKLEVKLEAFRPGPRDSKGHFIPRSEPKGTSQRLMQKADAPPVGMHRIEKNSKAAK